MSEYLHKMCLKFSIQVKQVISVTACVATRGGFLSIFKLLFFVVYSLLDNGVLTANIL